MSKRCSLFTICIFTRHTIALIIIVVELHTMYAPSIIFHFTAQIHLYLGYRPQQVDIREILTLAGSKCKVNILDAPHGQILRICFVIKRLLGDIRMVVVFLQVFRTHIEICINHHFSFKMIAHKYLIAHRQRSGQPVDITAFMNEHHVLQDSRHLLICLIENDVESAKVDTVFHLRSRIFSLTFFTSRSNLLPSRLPYSCIVIGIRTFQAKGKRDMGFGILCPCISLVA